MQRLKRIITLSLLLAGCGASRDDVIEAQLAQAIQTTGGELRLARYVRGEWDRFCKVNAGTTPASIDSLLGFPWPGAKRAGMTDSDNATLLIFIRDDVVAEDVLFPRDKGRFPGGNYCMTRETARFQVVQDTTDPGARDLIPIDSTRM